MNKGESRLGTIKGYGLLDKTSAVNFSDHDDRIPSARKWVYGSKDYPKT